VNLVLRGGTVVTSLDPPSLRPTDVTVVNGRVAAEGDTEPGADAIDCTGCLVIPGNVCAHHHLYSALARGMPYRLEPPQDFLQVLQRVWWRLDRALDESSILHSAFVGGADALLAGTTTIVDHHASPNTIDRSLEWLDGGLRGLGARRILCYEVTDRDGLDRAAAGLEETHLRLEEPASAGHVEPLLRTMVGAHASFTLSPETLHACVSLADEFDVGIHVHVAEDGVDERDSEARFGRRVIERLADAGALSDRSLLAHCVHVDDRETALIRETGAWVAHNARSNMNNRVGRAPVGRLGDRVALGTDGIDGDMFAESRAAYWRGREDDPSITPSWVLGRLAAGAAFAGRAFDEPLFGRIEPGAPADLVVLDYDPPTPLTAENLAGHWMFGLSARDVRDVVVGGSVVVRDQRLVHMGEAELRAFSQATAQELWRRMDDIEEHPFAPTPGGTER
jgi:putative selenium metabolism protein SsnA